MPQCFLTAGCLYQTVWNLRSGLSPHENIKDYDVFYYDASDLSWEAEDAVIERVSQCCLELNATVEVKNQARVHLWYEQKFGRAYPALQSTTDGIDRYLIECTRVGIDVETQGVYAPIGFADLWDGVLRMNPLNPNPSLFHAKAEDFKRRWQWLQIA